jgi:phosphoribosylglycinamide formyltransferase-1
MLTHRPRVAVLCSRRCPGLENLLKGQRRREFDLACCLVSDGALEKRERLEAARVPVLDHPIRAFYRGRPTSDLARRRAYDRETVAALAPHRPDFVLLSSYLYILTEPMLEAFPGRIANVHGSDLTRIGPDARPLYVGLHAARDAIRAGEHETRATVHVVTERLDEGPILARSIPFAVAPLVADLRRRGLVHAVNAYAFAHQEWMIATAWGPLLTDAVALLHGRLAPRLEWPASAPAPQAFPESVAAGGRP